MISSPRSSRPRPRSRSRSPLRSSPGRSPSRNVRKSSASRSRSASHSRSPSNARSSADDKSPARAQISPKSKPVTLRVENLTRNVNADHLREIFGKFGLVVRVDMAVPRGKASAVVAFAAQKDADSAKDHMHDGWLDGNKLRVLPDAPKPDNQQGNNRRTPPAFSGPRRTRPTWRFALPRTEPQSKPQLRKQPTWRTVEVAGVP
ncbi:RNA-binding protein with serine-rich domain 1 [Phytophthora ramorum]